MRNTTRRRTGLKERKGIETKIRGSRMTGEARKTKTTTMKDPTKGREKEQEE